MVITEVILNHYRNWARLALEPNPRLNVVTGPNGQGKSNLLEALYALVDTHPYRAQRDIEVVRFGESFAHVYARLCGGGRDVSCEIVWQVDDASPQSQRVRKEVRLNRQPVHRVGDFFGRARMVLFAPRDLELVNGAPERRRLYLDVLLSQLHPGHLDALRQYKRVLTERNSYLRSAGQGVRNPALEEAWNEQMARWGSDIMDRRRLALERLSPILERIHLLLGGKAEQVRLRYLPSARSEPGESSREALARCLVARAREELIRGITLSGPHRDDVEILLNGRSMRLYASQGQVRSMALAMRLAEGDILERDGGEAPVLLLDDCLSEMDERRQEALWRYLGERDQVFVTTSQWPAGQGLPVTGVLFRVGDGRIQEVEQNPCSA